MNPRKRVFITGMGVLSAAGQSVDENWQSVLNGKSHLAPIQAYDLSDWPTQLGGELKNFQPAKQLPDKKLMKAISYQDAIGILAAGQAIEHSQLIPDREKCTDQKAFNDMTGVFVGSPGNKYLQQYDFLPLLAKSNDDMQTFAQALSSEVHPMWLLRILPNNVLAYTGILHGFKGVNHNITNHAVGGIQALIEAYHAIQSGQIDRAVVVAYDLAVEPQSLFYYNKLGLLTADNLRPFDAQHSGTVLANGAASIVIESEQSVKARQAKTYAELLGGQSKTEGEGLFNLDADAKSLSNLMQSTLESTQTQAENLACIVAHGNGSQASDDSESIALHRVFNGTTPPITGFKWSLGHTLVASGLIDTILAAQALHHKTLPGIATLQKKAPLAEPLNISQTPQPITQGNTALIINRGFASMNACIAIKACE